MKHQLTTVQIESYRSSGFLVIENFLSGDELEHWQKTVTTAVKERGGIKIPGKEIKVGEADGINEDADYFGKVFDQLINLWQTDKGVREIMLDERLGKMAAQ